MTAPAVARVGWRPWVPCDAPAGLIVFSETRDGWERWAVRIEPIYNNDTNAQGTRLRLADNSYRAFAEFPELFAALADQPPHTVEQAQALLARLGIEESR